MDSQKRAFTIAGIGLGAVALAMVLFYYFQNRVRKPEGEDKLTERVEAVQSVRPEFAGLYAATDGAMETPNQRITSFSVISADGMLTGSARIDSIGKDETVTVSCADVRVEEKEFFLKCQDVSQGILSLNGAWAKDENGAITVNGKVLWTKEGELLLDVDRKFQLLKN